MPEHYRVYLTGAETPPHPTGMGYRDCFVWQDSDCFVLFYPATCEGVRVPSQTFRGLAPELAPGYSLEGTRTRIKNNMVSLKRQGITFDQEVAEQALQVIDLTLNPPVTRFRVRSRG